METIAEFYGRYVWHEGKTWLAATVKVGEKIVGRKLLVMDLEEVDNQSKGQKFFGDVV